jgi:hypothetical protein
MYGTQKDSEPPVSVAVAASAPAQSSGYASQAGDTAYHIRQWAGRLIGLLARSRVITLVIIVGVLATACAYLGIWTIVHAAWQDVSNAWVRGAAK